MATIDQQFVEYIVKTLVNNPEKVAVERSIDERGVLLTLTVDPSDIGRVIGRRGMTAQAIRVLLRALGTKQDARYNLKIVDTEGERDEVDNDTRHDDIEAEDATARDDEVDDDDESGDDEENQEEVGSSELAEKTRAELADLDDLDI